MKTDILGLEVIEELDIKCGDCNSVLAHIVVSETNETRASRKLKSLHSQYKINKCYKCDGSSFWTRVVEGSPSICPAKDCFDLEEVDTSIKDGVICSELEIIKR